jgi:hemolysin III
MRLPAGALPARRHAERAADLCVLSCGVVLGLAGSAVLIAAAAAAHDARLATGIGIYVAGLLAMLGCSLVYHASFGSPRRALYRRLDHAAIFAMIAGTATPFALGRTGSDLGYGPTAAIWAAAAIGIFVKLRFPIWRMGWSAAIYVLLGWAVAIAVGPPISTSPTAELVVAGGAFYTIGLVFHFCRRLPFHNAVWHGFVIAGAACHYLAVIGGVVFA